MTARELAEEIIREKLWQTLNQVGKTAHVHVLCRRLVVRFYSPTVLPLSLNCCLQEIPYGLRHKITSWKTLPGASASLGIECDVIVPRKHLKSIVIGKDGKVVKKVSQAAAAEMQQRFQRPVSLAIRVKSSV
jgi:hypothetical protein|eukprot:COSAG02_NODE_6027_length_3863_cov_2.471573_2_plen_132_part_00